jgi:endonuclease YncB( thermonuclease family)
MDHSALRIVRHALAGFVVIAFLAGAAGASAGSGDKAPATDAAPPAGDKAAPADAATADAAKPGGDASNPDAAKPADEIKISQKIDDMVRVRQVVMALDRPDPAGKPLGRLRPGVKIKAIGVVEGGKWVQIALPNKNLAFVPDESLAIGDHAGELPKIAGPATGVPNAASLVIDKQTVQLSGIDPGPASALGPYEAWVKSHGPLECEPVADTGRYRCLTSTGNDVAEAAILNGAGRVGDGASATYREREKAAREQKKGLWGAN